jgi:hypothetical protein
VRRPVHFSFQIRRCVSKSRNEDAAAMSIPSRSAATRMRRSAAAAAACSTARGASIRTT